MSLDIDGRPDLRIVRATDPPPLDDWREVHNLVIPTAPLTTEEVRERATRNELTVAYHRDVLVGCATVRPPNDEGTSVVIARVLPAHRRRGVGDVLYRDALERARARRPRDIETVVLESNADGLHFALRHGFAEVERHVLPGDTIAFVSLRLVSEPATGW